MFLYKAHNIFQNEFGGEVILEDGSGQLDRDALRRIILADDNKRRSLDRITHPYILWQMAWEVVSLAASGNNFAVLDIPLLFESGGIISIVIIEFESYILKFRNLITI